MQAEKTIKPKPYTGSWCNNCLTRIDPGKEKLAIDCCFVESFLFSFTLFSWKTILLFNEGLNLYKAKSKLWKDKICTCNGKLCIFEIKKSYRASLKFSRNFNCCSFCWNSKFQTFHKLKLIIEILYKL